MRRWEPRTISAGSKGLDRLVPETVAVEAIWMLKLVIGINADEELLALLNTWKTSIGTTNVRIDTQVRLEVQKVPIPQTPFFLTFCLTGKHIRELTNIKVFRLKSLPAAETSPYVQSKAGKSLLATTRSVRGMLKYTWYHRLPTQAPCIAASVRRSSYSFKANCTKLSLRAHMVGTKRLLKKPSCRGHESASTAKLAFAIPPNSRQS